MMICRGVIALALSCAGQASAQELSLIPPIDCDLTKDCYIQQYVDHDPSAGARDFRCAPLTYDGHKGTDFAPVSHSQMQAGVPVIAAAAGVVKGLRDGMADTGTSGSTDTDLAGRECGNGVVLDHGGGWETQYCHLQQGSVVVTKGEKVAAGAPLGLVGQSGQAAFAHVHLSVRRNGAVIDPFDPKAEADCTIAPETTLWAAPLSYRPGGFLQVAFADNVPDFTAIRAGHGTTEALTINSPALVVFGHTFGTQRGDVMALSITGPNGELVADEITLDRTQAQAFRAIGKRRSAAQWEAGTYTGTVTLMRGTEQIDRRETVLVLE